MTASETLQILDCIQALRGDFQSVYKKPEIHIVRTEEQFKTPGAKVKAEINQLRIEIKALNKKVDDQRERQRGTDSLFRHLWWAG